jgi:protein TonB
MRVTDISEFDYLIFENRNRDYGAFRLRRNYNSVVIVGIIFASLLASAAVILPFVINPPDDRILSGGGRYVQVQMEALEPPVERIIVPPAPPPDKTNISEIVKYVPPVVVDSLIVFDSLLPTTDEALARTDDELPDLSGNGYGDSDLLAPGDGYGTDEPFFMVEVMPSFRGGDINNFRDWIARRTNYPQEAVEAKIKGTVFLTFVVERDGSVSNITILKGVHPLIDNEAVKTISESPKWSPGLQRGEPVRVRFQIPLSFIP